MPGVTLLSPNNSFFVNYGGDVDGDPINLSGSYPNPNIEGDIGLLFIQSNLPPESITSLNGNNWVQITNISSNFGSLSIWVCMQLNPGSETVTTATLVTNTYGGPNMVGCELVPPPCPLGSVMCGAFIPGPGIDTGLASSGPLLQYSDTVIAPGFVYYHTLVVGIATGWYAQDSVQRTGYDLSSPSENIYTEEIIYYASGGTVSGCLGMTTMPYPNTQNWLQFNPEPNTPDVPLYATEALGVVFTTVS